MSESSGETVQVTVQNPAQQNEEIGAVLRIDGVKRSYRQGEREIRVLDDASIAIAPGEAVALVGPSGSGKSTLLHCAGLLETPDAGSIVVGGVECAGLDDDRRTAVRRNQVGFIYQFHQLLPEFSALENVVMPQLIQGVARRVAEERARELLSTLGLGERLHHRPAQLSGGEQQRAAICRALAAKPVLLLADEPTGNLDPATSELVFGELIDLIRREKVAALIATHNMELAQRMDRIVRLDRGRLSEVPRG